MFSLKDYKEPSHKLCDYLPWAALIAPGVVLQKDGLVQKTIAFRGPDLASSSKSELMAATAKLNNALKRLDTGWAIFIEAQRFFNDEYPTAPITNPIAWLIDTERMNQFKESDSHFESSYFLTFTFKLPSTQSKAFERFFYEEDDRDFESENAKDVEQFIQKCHEIIDIMKHIFVDVGALDDDQTVTYLHSTISTNSHPVKAPDPPMYLDAVLPDQAFTPGDISLLGDYYIPTITFSGFPSTSYPGILDDLNYLTTEYRWVTRFIFIDKDEAKREIEKYRKKWWQKRKNLWTLIKEEASKEESSLVDNDAANKAADADAALQELGEDLVAYGYMTCTVTTWNKDRDEAIRQMDLIKQVIQSRGFVVKEETLNGKEAWFGSLPGHVYANVKRPILNTLNLTHLMPVSAIWAGDENEHLKSACGCGVPHVICSTAGDTSFSLNFNVGDVGHGLIAGPTGAGKSVIIALLALQWLKYPNAQVIIFDKDRSARAATIAVGGDYYEPGNTDAPVSFQPLRDIADPAERAWASEFIANLIAIQNLEVTPKMKDAIETGLISMVDDPIKNISIFSDFVQDQDVKNGLRQYTMQGCYGHIFDGKKDDLKEGFWQMFEMSQLMSLGDEAITPALDYIFHKVEKRFDGKPTLMILDEAWLFLSHPIFERKLKAWLKTLRKKNVYVVFATQEISDALGSNIMTTILSACHTKIFLPDEEAKTPAMSNAYQFFGLSETEIDLLANAQKKRDYYYRSSKGRRMFQLEMGSIALTFAAMSSDKDHKFMDQLIPGKTPVEYAKEMLRYKGLDWAVDVLNSNLQREKRAA